MTSPLIRYHGGKFRMADWIISHFPFHVTYVEPFGGSAGVLLQKKPSKVEVYNDLDGDIVNLFRVVRDRGHELAEKIRWTPFSRDEFLDAYEDAEDPLERARRTIIQSFMGFGSAAATKGNTGFRGIDSGSHSVNRWVRQPDVIEQIRNRLIGVVIENLPAIDAMKRFDSKDTLHYIDPPYLFNTRSSTCNGMRSYYRHEMTDDDHIKLLGTVRKLKGMAIISGYRSEIYDDFLRGWKRVSKFARASGHRGTVNREEVLWISPKISTTLF